METDRNKYGLSIQRWTDEEIVKKIHRLEDDLQRIETYLEICWEEIRKRET